MYDLKGIAWDDEPDDFMARLQSYLRSTYNIDLVIYDDREQFLQAFVNGSWDFAVLDVFDERGGTPAGVALARLVADMKRLIPWYLIILISGEPLTTKETAGLPANVSFRHKVEFEDVAYYIVEQLRQRGVLVNRRRVFQIVNSDPGVFARAGAKVKERLELRNLVAIVVGGGNLRTEIAAGLLQQMNESAAIVAVCTPDDEWRDGTKHPRQNVLLEIGMAMGLSRGLERLIILKHRGANLPTDLGGVLTLNFDDDVSATFPELETRLRELGIDFSAQGRPDSAGRPG